MSSAATHMSPPPAALTSTRSLTAFHRERWSLYRILYGLLGGYGPDPLPGSWVTELEQLALRQMQPQIWIALAAGLRNHPGAPISCGDPGELDALYKIGILARQQARAL